MLLATQKCGKGEVAASHLCVCVGDHAPDRKRDSEKGAKKQTIR